MEGAKLCNRLITTVDFRFAHHPKKVIGQQLTARLFRLRIVKPASAAHDWA
jgi:hypothetical protein